MIMRGRFMGVFMVIGFLRIMVFRMMLIRVLSEVR